MSIPSYGSVPDPQFTEAKITTLSEELGRWDQLEKGKILHLRIDSIVIENLEKELKCLCCNEEAFIKYSGLDDTLTKTKLEFERLLIFKMADLTDLSLADQYIEMAQQALRAENVSPTIKNNIEKLKRAIDKRREPSKPIQPVKEMGDVQVAKAEATLITVLPNDTQLYVISFLGAKELGRMACVNKAFMALADTNSLWKKLCSKDENELVMDDFDKCQNDHKNFYKEAYVVNCKNNLGSIRFKVYHKEYCRAGGAVTGPLYHPKFKFRHLHKLIIRYVKDTSKSKSDLIEALDKYSLKTCVRGKHFDDELNMISIDPSVIKYADFSCIVKTS